jgi:Sec-independent protein secretion pathway component TatC
MSRRFARLILRSYPPEWRAQYGQELEDLLCRRVPRISDFLDVVWSGLVERMRRPTSRLWFYALGGCAVTFLISLIFAEPLWRLMATPVAGALRERGIGPNPMVATRPFEQLEVVWLGVPALLTVLISFALMLFLLLIFFSNAKEIQTRRWATRFLTFSGSVFALCAALSITAWRNGSIAWLLQLYPDVSNAPLLSVGHCFVLLSTSMLGTIFLPQIPIITFFAWRFRAMQHLERSARR